MPRQPDHLRGTTLGVADRVSSAWSDYTKADVESRPEKVHYEVLRLSGFDADRAREIAKQSASQQGYLLDEHRHEQGLPTVGSRYAGGLRFKTPHFGEFAGRLCRVLEKGQLEPVDSESDSLQPQSIEPGAP